MTTPTCCVLSSLPPAQCACPESGAGMTTAPAEGCSAVAGFLTGAALLTCPIKWNQFPKSGNSCCVDLGCGRDVAGGFGTDNNSNNNRLFMAPRLVRAQSADNKDIMIHS